MTKPLFLLDSNICIYILRDRRSAPALRLGECEPGSVQASSVTYAEVLLGLASADEEDKAAFERLFDAVPVVPFDVTAARIYAGLPFKRGTFDRLIAAHALALGVILITNNEADFADIPDLRIENWTKP